MAKLNSIEYKSFEDIRQVRENGTEYWTARELTPVLEYAKWGNFAIVINFSYRYTKIPVCKF